MISYLGAERCKNKEHANIEQYIQHEGFELLKHLFQGYLLQLESQQTIKPSVVNSQEKLLSNKKKRTSRQLTTLFGEVIVNRVRYASPNEKSVFPLDKKLNSRLSQGEKREIMDNQGVDSKELHPKPLMYNQPINFILH